MIHAWATGLQPKEFFNTISALRPSEHSAANLKVQALSEHLGFQIYASDAKVPVTVSGEMRMKAMTVRIARPSDDLDALLPFYRDGLGLEVLGSFRNHDGFDGVIIGVPGASYHFEFTKKLGHVAGSAPSQDNLAVFYLADKEAWRSAVHRMRRAGFDPVASCNPYWDVNGRTFEDPDGYRVVLQNAVWTT